jgi:molybdopterin-guanine dinucleotide biosynthesis protein A
MLPLPENQSLTFIEHLVSVLAACCTEVLVVVRDEGHTRDYTFPGVRVVCDKTPGRGPLMGVYSGLSAMHTRHALVVAVDMPFIQSALVSFLLSQPLADALLVPIVDNVPQVMLAVYPHGVLPLIEERIQQGRQDLRCLLEAAPVRYIEEASLRQVDPQLRSFVNVNTPEELREIM